MSELSKAPSASQRCGVVAVVGRPNVGKSTLINHIVGEKVSITANRPQTTRHQVRGIWTRDAHQIVFIDTPGIHQQSNRALNRHLNRSARSALEGVDVVVFMARALRWTEDDALVLHAVQESGLPYLFCLNMLDRVERRDALLPFIAENPASDQAHAVLMISAERGDGVDTLCDQLCALLPEAPHQFDAELFTDRSERFLAAEYVREQATRLLDKELPYSLTVEIEGFEQRGQQRRIAAVLWVEREGQKAILIGKKGQMLKRIGSLARQSMIHQFGGRVHLDLWVRVRKDWSDNDNALKSFGYQS